MQTPRGAEKGATLRVVKEEGTSDDQHHHKVYGRSGSKEQRHCVLVREEDGTLSVSFIHHIMNLYKLVWIP